MKRKIIRPKRRVFTGPISHAEPELKPQTQIGKAEIVLTHQPVADLHERIAAIEHRLLQLSYQVVNLRKDFAAAIDQILSGVTFNNGVSRTKLINATSKHRALNT